MAETFRWYCPVCKERSRMTYLTQEAADTWLSGHYELWHRGMEDHGSDQDD